MFNDIDIAKMIGLPVEDVEISTDGDSVDFTLDGGLWTLAFTEQGFELSHDSGLKFVDRSVYEILKNLR